MYRADRFSRVNHTDRTPLVITVIASSVLFIAIACGVRQDLKQGDSTVAAVKPPAAPASQPSANGTVVDSTHLMPENVTFASAEAAYNKRHFVEATESFDAYVQRHPGNAYGHYMLGLSAWKTGDLPRARAAFERSLEIDSTNVKTLLNLGRVLLDQGNANDALSRVGSAAALDTGSAEVRRMMGRVQVALGQPDSAIASYRVALSIDPSDSWSMNNLGLILIDQGRYDEALPPLARAVELRPESPAFANNLGVALERTGHTTAAADAYRAALKSDSTYTKASVSLARVDGKPDTTTIDVGELAAKFNDELQSAREQRLAKLTIKPDSVKTPER
jgi:tetratricopeptide (TPR) repeat protein